MFVSVQFKLEFENKQDKEKVLALMSLQSSAIRFIYNRLKEEKKDQELGKTSQSAWRVLKVAFVLPLLGKFKKPILVEEKWKRQIARLVPSGFGGTMPRENTG